MAWHPLHRAIGRLSQLDVFVPLHLDCISGLLCVQRARLHRVIIVLFLINLEGGGGEGCRSQFNLHG
jgi:hypothetical protein